MKERPKNAQTIEEQIAAVVKNLNPDPDPEIPGTDECRNRFKVKVRVSNGKLIKETTVDCVYVGKRSLMLVWKWKRICGFRESTPDVFTYPPDWRDTLVEIGPRLFSLDTIIQRPRKKVRPKKK